MRQASKRIPESAEKTVRDIRRATRRHHSAEEKIRIVLEGHMDSSSKGGLPGQFRAPLQLHRGLDRLDAFASRSNGLTERSPEPLIGFDKLRVLIPARQSAALIPACSAARGGSCDDCSSPQV